MNAENARRLRPLIILATVVWLGWGPSGSALSQPVPLGTSAQAETDLGKPMNLDVQGADLRAVLRSIAEFSGVNIVADREIEGPVTRPPGPGPLASSPGHHLPVGRTGRAGRGRIHPCLHPPVLA